MAFYKVPVGEVIAVARAMGVTSFYEIVGDGFEVAVSARISFGSGSCSADVWGTAPLTGPGETLSGDFISQRIRTIGVGVYITEQWAEPGGTYRRLYCHRGDLEGREALDEAGFRQRPQPVQSPQAASR